jgi:hypothetical protein
MELSLFSTVYWCHQYHNYETSLAQTYTTTEIKNSNLHFGIVIFSDDNHKESLEDIYPRIIYDHSQDVVMKYCYKMRMRHENLKSTMNKFC